MKILKQANNYLLVVKSAQQHPRVLSHLDLRLLACSV